MITGKQLRDAVISGANSILKNRKFVDDLNIFPVPDGDTGTNMSMTIGAGSDAMQALEAGEVKADDAVRIILANGDEYEGLGVLDFVDSVVNPNTDSVRLRATFANPEGKLLHEELVRVRLATSSAAEVLTVPIGAVQRDLTGDFVMLVNDHDEVEQRRIAVADRDAGNLQCAFLRQQFADKGNAFVGGNRTVHLDTPFLCCLHNVVCVLDDAAAGPGRVCCGRALLLKCRGDSDERGLRIGRTGSHGALCAVLPAAIQNHVCGRSAALNHACAGVERVLCAAPLRCRQVNGRFARFEDDGRCVEPGLKREIGRASCRERVSSPV